MIVCIRFVLKWCTSSEREVERERRRERRRDREGERGKLRQKRGKRKGCGCVSLLPLHMGFSPSSTKYKKDKDKTFKGSCIFSS